MKVLVTGGGGFLGKAIVKMLLEQGGQVRSFSRNSYAELAQRGVEQFLGDLGDSEAVSRAVDGCDIVYHVAAKAGVWGPFADYYKANVLGTKHVIESCRKKGIGRLVYTSSPSVVFDGSDMEGIDESVPYPDHYEAFYPQTKAMAEKMVLQANDNSLATVALRPHLIWGPEDNHLVPRILERGAKGALCKIGRRPCLVDTTYIDNAAAAHLRVAEYLAPNSAVAGKAYFLSQGEPLPLWDVVNRILAAGQLPPVTRTISPRLAFWVAGVLENTYRLLRITKEPPMTRFVARELSTSHWFDLTAARRDFGYDPKVSFNEGIDRLRNWLEKRSVK